MKTPTRGKDLSPFSSPRITAGKILKRDKASLGTPLFNNTSNQNNSDRPRTPSGTATLSSSVDEIKALFSKNTEDEKVSEESVFSTFKARIHNPINKNLLCADYTTSPKLPGKVRKANHTTSRPSNNRSAQPPVKPKQQQLTTFFQQKEPINKSPKIQSADKLPTEDQITVTSDERRKKRKMQEQQTTPKGVLQTRGVKSPDPSGNKRKAEHTDETVSNEDSTPNTDSPVSEGNTHTPGIMDLNTVVKMFTELKMEMSGVNKKLAAIEQRDSTASIEALTSAQQNTNSEVLKLKNELEVVKVKNTVMNCNISRLTQVVDELQEKIDRIEVDKCKRMTILSGFYAEDRKDDMLQQINDFLQAELGTNVTAEDAYKMGQGKPANIVITLSSVNEKRKIYENSYKLEEFTNADGKHLKFRDFFTQASLEKRKKQQDILDLNNENPVKTAEVTYANGTVLLDGNPYRKQITSPDPAAILQMHEGELEKILSMKIAATKSLEVNGNTFIGYSICANTYPTIRDAYMHIKLANAAARHIVAAWRIQGLPEYEANDYNDDREFFAGKQILEFMKKYNITNRAIFVVRYASQEKLGNTRFKYYIQAAAEAIRASSYNKITGMEQNIPDDEEILEAKNTTAYGNRYDRGSRGGYRRRGGPRSRGGPKGRGRGGRGRGFGHNPAKTYAAATTSTSTRGVRHSTQGYKNHHPAPPTFIRKDDTTKNKEYTFNPPLTLQHPDTMTNEMDWGNSENEETWSNNEQVD